MITCIADEAQGMVDRAASRAGILDHREPTYDAPEHADTERFYSIATGKLVRFDTHLEKYLATLGERERKTVDMKRSTKEFLRRVHLHRRRKAQGGSAMGERARPGW